MNKTIFAQFIPIIAIFVLLSQPKQFLYYSNCVLGKLALLAIILFYTLLDKTLGAIVLVLVAVVLVAFVPGQDFRLPSLRAVLYSVGAGVGFAGIFVFLDQAPSDSGLATLIVMRIVGIVLMLAGLTFAFFRFRPKQFLETAVFGRSLIWLVLLAGLGDVLGNVFFLVATRAGELAIAAVLTSLYPVGTILLARIVLKERIAKSQTLGIVLAIGACVLIAIGKPA